MSAGAWNGRAGGLPLLNMLHLRLLGLVVIAPVLMAAAPADVSDLLEPIRKKHDVPALAGAVLVGDKVIAIGVAGVRRADTLDVKATVADKWHLGSCTKAMTATMIATLVEEKKLRWDSTVAEVFPKLKVHEAARGITLEQLLSHRSGLPANMRGNPEVAKLYSLDNHTVQARRWLTALRLSEKPDHEPGTKFVYSNTGYMIAAHMAEEVTDRSWEDLMRERLFTPLGMASAGFGPPGVKGKLDQPRGHTKLNVSFEPGGSGADNPLVYGPAGTVHATLEDWAKFVSLHLRAARGDCQLLKPETFKKLQTAWLGKESDKDRYAFGWGIAERPWAQGEVLTHSGSNLKWFCVTWIAPKRNFAVLIVCNDGDGAKAADDAAGALINYHLKKRP
jgi:CubicO group peptidase (beta-lactamase class C family)